MSSSSAPEVVRSTKYVVLVFSYSTKIILGTYVPGMYALSNSVPLLYVSHQVYLSTVYCQGSDFEGKLTHTCPRWYVYQVHTVNYVVHGVNLFLLCS